MCIFVAIPYVQEWEKLIKSMPSEYKSSARRFKRAYEIMTTEAEPEVGLTPKEVIWKRIRQNYIAIRQ